jgi:hypothetical protein
MHGRGRRTPLSGFNEGYSCLQAYFCLTGGSNGITPGTTFIFIFFVLYEGMLGHIHGRGTGVHAGFDIFFMFVCPWTFHNDRLGIGLVKSFPLRFCFVHTCPNDLKFAGLKS